MILNILIWMSKTALQLHKKNFGDELNLYEDWEQDKSEVLNEFERSYSCTSWPGGAYGDSGDNFDKNHNPISIRGGRLPPLSPTWFGYVPPSPSSSDGRSDANMLNSSIAIFLCVVESINRKLIWLINQFCCFLWLYDVVICWSSPDPPCVVNISKRMSLSMLLRVPMSTPMAFATWSISEPNDLSRLRKSMFWPAKKKEIN